MPGGTGGQLLALKQHHVAPTRTCQMVGGAGADDASANDDGTGRFTVHTNIDTGGSGDFLQGVAVADFRAGAGRQIALSWHNDGGGVQAVNIPADPVGTQWPFSVLSTTTQSEDLSVGDIDGDRDLDLLLGTQWLRNDSGSWTKFDIASFGPEVDRNRLADFDGDGDLDAALGFLSRQQLIGQRS